MANQMQYGNQPYQQQWPQRGGGSYAYQGEMDAYRGQEAGTISRRAYNAIMGLLLVAGFGVVALGSWLATQEPLSSIIAQNGMVLAIGVLVGTIVGMIMIGIGTSKQSVALSLIGYIVFICSFGIMTSVWLPRYNFDTITQALVLTAGISLLFTALGILFPNAMAKAAVVASFTNL